MGENTGISWCDHTFNPWIGCTKIDPACKNCYAETYGTRFGVRWGTGGDRRITSDANWKQPLKWNREAKRDGVRRRVFCASLADVFEDHLGIVAARAQLFKLIEECDSLDWLLLTKRPENMVGFVPESWLEGWPLHVWAGTSAGNQETLDRVAWWLFMVPSAVHFLSLEPLLGPVNLRPCAGPMLGGKVSSLDALNEGGGLDWVIVGGESGAHARSCSVEWIRSIRRQCQEAGVPVFVKQMGANYCDAINGIGGRSTPQPDNIPPIKRLVHPSGADPSEWPEDLRVREWPRA